MSRNYLHSGLIMVMILAGSCAMSAVEYYKEVRKSISVNKNVRLNADLSFADFNVQTWEQPTMEIVVKMDVNAKSQDRANEMFERFKLEITESQDLVGLTIGAGNWSCDGKNSESYQVIVDLKMPLDAVLDGKVAFGDVVISDMRGACELNLEYGDAKINGLWSYENDFRVAFGDADINGTNGGDFRNEYGSLEIGLLQGNAEIHSSFGDLEIDKVAKECKDLEIKVEYADAEIDLASDAGFRFEANSSYGDIDLPSSAKRTVVKEDYTAKEVQGTIGQGAGKLEVECDFGDVDIDIAGE